MKEMYSRLADKVLKKAKFHNCKKYDVNTKELTSLIGVGGKIHNMNTPAFGGNYIHEVIYQGYTFVATTKKPEAFEIDACLR